MLPELAQLFQYKNNVLLERFGHKHPEYAQQADLIFQDLLRFLWLGEHHSQAKKNFPQDETLQFTPLILEEMYLIDEMWHEFILMTRDYEAFCHHHFGKFIHHEINPNRQVENREHIYQEIEHYLSYIYDHLGEHVLKRWFQMHLQE